MRTSKIKTSINKFNKVKTQVEINGTKYSISHKWLKWLRIFNIMEPLTEDKLDKYLSQEYKIAALEKENKRLISYIVQELEPITTKKGYTER